MFRGILFIVRRVTTIFLVRCRSGYSIPIAHMSDQPFEMPFPTLIPIAYLCHRSQERQGAGSLIIWKFTLDRQTTANKDRKPMASGQKSQKIKTFITVKLTGPENDMETRT